MKAILGKKLGMTQIFTEAEVPADGWGQVR